MSDDKKPFDISADIENRNWHLHTQLVGDWWYAEISDPLNDASEDGYYIPSIGTSMAANKETAIYEAWLVAVRMRE